MNKPEIIIKLIMLIEKLEKRELVNLLNYGEQLKDNKK